MGETVKVESVSSDSLLSGIKSQAATMATFLANMTKLKTMKLSKAVINALYAAGPAASAGQAAAFAGMTSDQIKQYNASYYAMRGTSSKLATAELGKAQAPKNVTIQSGALKVDIHIAGNASEHDVNAAVAKAFKKLTKELHSK
jgi:hypothetical protein